VYALSDFQANKSKHGISFEEAQTVSFDENAIEFDDPDHSVQEERFLLLGLSQNFKILLVCHCYKMTNLKFGLFPQEKQLKRSKQPISGEHYEKGV
jgi:uncharacterized protein